MSFENLTGEKVWKILKIISFVKVVMPEWIREFI